MGTTVLLEHNSVLTSPQDYVILGFRPITSRTYFFARLANALAYTTAITTVATYLPAVSLFLRHGALVGLAGLAALYGCSFFTAFAILFGYGWLMNAIGADTLKRALSYVQLVMSFAIYGGYMLMSRVVSASALQSLSLPKSPWLLLVPPAWFAAYLDVASGNATWFEFLIAGLSVIGLVALASGLSGRLSMDYSDRLAAIAASTQKVRVTRGNSRPGWWFRTGEARAVSVLVRAQFRNDQRFRMFIKTLREGKHMATSRPILPPMPWQVYRNFTDDDLKAIFAYLRTVQPVQHRVDNTEEATSCTVCGGRHGFGDKNHTE